MSMVKLCECVWANIRKAHTSGRKDDTYLQTTNLKGLLPDVDLDKCRTNEFPDEISGVDAECGIKTKDLKDFQWDMVSYMYTPATPSVSEKKNTNVRGLAKAAYRSNLKEKDIRGEPVYRHALFFEKNKETASMHVSDLLGQLKEKWLEGIAYEEDGTDVVEGTKKNDEPIEIDAEFPAWDVVSEVLYRQDGEERKNKEQTVRLLRFLNLAMRENKKLVYVYAPKDWKQALCIMRAALRLLPCRIANEVGFDTCCGVVPKNMGRQFYGVPACDKSWIENNLLRNSNFYVAFFDDGRFEDAWRQEQNAKLPRMKPGEDIYADFLEQADEETLRIWFEALREEETHITSSAEFNMFLRIFQWKNKSVNEGKEFNEACERLHILASGKNLEFALKRNRLQGILWAYDAYENSFEFVFRCAAMNKINYDGRSVKDKLLFPLIDLYKETNGKCQNDEDDLLLQAVCNTLFYIEEDDALQERHYKFFDEHFPSIREKLECCKKALIKKLSAEWHERQRFFDGYAGSRYKRAYKGFCQWLLKDLLNGNGGENECLHDYFLGAFCSLLSGESGEDELLRKGLLESVFAGERSLDASLDFVRAKILGNGSGESVGRDADCWLRSFVKFVGEKGKLENTIQYYLDIETSPYSVKVGCETAVLDELLRVYISGIPADLYGKDALDKILERYERVRRLCADCGGHISVYKKLYGDFNRRILQQSYQTALSATAPERVAQADVERYTTLAVALQRDAESGDSCFGDGVGQLLDAWNAWKRRYDSFCKQRDAARASLTFRAEEIAKMLLLLNDKTIIELLEAHIGKAYMRQWFREKGIKRRNPSKNPDFGKMVKELIVSFYRGELKDAEGRAIRPGYNDKLSGEIRRRYNEQSVTIGKAIDASGGFLQSLLFALIISVFAGGISYLCYRFFSDSYFVLICVIMAAVAFAVAQVTFWLNYPFRYVRSVVIEAFWQSLCIVCAVIAVYFGTYRLLTILNL